MPWARFQIGPSFPRVQSRHVRERRPLQAITGGEEQAKEAAKGRAQDYHARNWEGEGGQVTIRSLNPGLHTFRTLLDFTQIAKGSMSKVCRREWREK